MHESTLSLASLETLRRGSIREATGLEKILEKKKGLPFIIQVGSFHGLSQAMREGSAGGAGWHRNETSNPLFAEMLENPELMDLFKTVLAWTPEWLKDKKKNEKPSLVDFALQNSTGREPKKAVSNIAPSRLEDLRSVSNELVDFLKELLVHFNKHELAFSPQIRSTTYSSDFMHIDDPHDERTGKELVLVWTLVGESTVYYERSETGLTEVTFPPGSVTTHHTGTKYSVLHKSPRTKEPRLALVITLHPKGIF